MNNSPLRMCRLGWSGVEIEFEGETLLIDYIKDTSLYEPLQNPDDPFPSSSRPGCAIGALLTHLHADHADPDALVAALSKGAPIFRPVHATGIGGDLVLTSYAEDKFTKNKIATEIIADWEERIIGPFRVHTAPAVDGFGDPQVTWIIECGDRRIIHAGDTMFHGFWWRIAKRFGPLDVAFLPINAPVVNFPPLQPATELEAVMNPEQAASAANILGAKLVVPIHYGSLHKPPVYIETQDSTKRLRERASIFGIKSIAYQAGEWFSVD
jgi:L-ascorbate metabolism protein UlaG (beta-lactamase superfamily)